MVNTEQVTDVQSISLTLISVLSFLFLLQMLPWCYFVKHGRLHTVLWSKSGGVRETLRCSDPRWRLYGRKVNGATGLGVREVFGLQSRVRLWCDRCGRCGWCSRCCRADGSVLVARTVAAVWRQGVGVQRFVCSWSQVGFARWPR